MTNGSRLEGAKPQPGPSLGFGETWPSLDAFEVLAQDRLLELLQRRARVDPELVHERPARVLVGVERLGLPPGAVERQHLLPAQALSQRVLPHEGGELRD